MEKTVESLQNKKAAKGKNAALPPEGRSQINNCRRKFRNRRMRDRRTSQEAGSASSTEPTGWVARWASAE